ncbi:ferredoxin-type protein NapF [Billgrantia diversa]|uniref:ferredoxin-type protein NapF n=1 Tax=Halomonas sp. MCCC 1A13316 TaxID=2733487 RepID=UPI0018A55827|nr:ferredoxin-type protein NapF [Halomonas sp. MCCC 1A13316]QOR40384.1 ferredoxin-type protein NapF [Halomonas sp. MCCC 1A13316]
MGVDPSRRALLKGRLEYSSALRPPWTRDEPEFLANCSQCGDCLQACETSIIVRDVAGFPQVDFQRGECTFCRACVDACEENIFRDPEREPPWRHVADIGPACLGPQGVYCRSCGESCEAGAIRFSFNAQRVPEPSVDTEACNGCGACVSVCPARAVVVGPLGPSHSARLQSTRLQEPS